MQASKYMVLKVDCKWSQKVFLKNKVLERLRTRETFKRSQTASAVPQFNYVIKVQGLKGVKLGSLRIDDFRTTTPLDCVTGLLRMLIWALAGVAPKSTPLLTAIRRRHRKSRT